MSQSSELISIQPPSIETALLLAPVLKASVVDSETGAPFDAEIDDILSTVLDSARGRNDNIYLLAQDLSGKPIGMIGLRRFRTGNNKRPADYVMPTYALTKKPVEIVHTHTRPDVRRKGLGRVLLSAIEDTARELGYTETLVNSGPRYEKTGWPFWTKMYGAPAYIAKEYYGKGWDGQIWRHKL